MNSFLRLTLVTMTVGGGFTGLAITSQSLLHQRNQPFLYHVLMFGFFALYAFVIVSGLILVQHPRRTQPIIVALALQVPWISSPFFAYKFAAGFQLSVGLIGGRFNTGFRVGSDFQINFFQPLPWGLGVNLVALCLMVLLMRAGRNA